MAKLIVKQTKSAIGRTPKQVANLKALGLHKNGAQREHEDTPVIRGMINKVVFMVEVTEKK